MTLSPNTTLQSGKYRIEATLGQGGFGITYLATQVNLGRRVAIKEFFMKDLCDRNANTSQVFVGSSGSREMVERFRAKFVKEAQTIAQFNNPHIVRIYDIFEENGTAYYVMEYHSGGSLADLVKSRGRLSEAEAVGYVRQIGDALDYLHARQINHLDVKPANVLLNEVGEAVLIDFGLAKHYDSEGNQTSTTPVGISHGYAPMEQYKKGGVGTFSPTTDVYSLGATLYKLLTGVTPPEASDIYDEGLPPMQIKVSPSVELAVSMAMKPRRQDRLQNIQAFLTLMGEPKATPTTTPEKVVAKKIVDTDKTEIAPNTVPTPQPNPHQATEVPTVTPKPKPSPAPKPKSKSRKWWILGILGVLLLFIGGYLSQSEQDIKVGDIITINGVEGIVYKVDDTGEHGMAMSLEQTECNWYDAKEWCSNLGEGWSLPSKDELLDIYGNKEKLNKVLSDSGCEQLGMGGYWSSKEDKYSSDSAWYVSMYAGNTNNANKNFNRSVRAVSAF